MSAGRLPPNPNLQNLRKQAKTFRRAVRAREPGALALAEELVPGATSARAGFSLAAAQLALARRYGFPNWRRLREYLEVVASFSRAPHRAGATGPAADEFLRLACLTTA